MTIEESVKKNPEVFEKIMKGKKEDLVYAFKDLAQKLDIIIWAAMAEYAKDQGTEANVQKVADYTEVNKIVSSNLDAMMKEFLVAQGKIR